MTVSTTGLRVTHLGNGATVAFSFPYRFLANGDLDVTLIQSDGTEVTQTLNTDYTVTGAGVESGGTVTMNVAPATGEKLFIRRELELTQEIDYITGDRFPAETHETALDRLTMIAQQLDEGVSRALKITSVDADAGVDPSLPPVSPGDAFTWSPDGTGFVNLPLRFGSLTPEDVIVAPNIALLRTLSGADGGYAFVAGYYAAGDGGGGPIRVWKSGEAPGTYVDNGGPIIVPTGGDGSGAWVWEYSGAVNVRWFGAVGDGVTDDTDSINGAIALAGQYGTVVFPDGQKSFLISSELVQLDGQQWIFEGGQRASKLLKGYNGNVIKTATLGRLISPFVDGNGATYTGTNIVIPSGTFSQYLENVRTVSSQGPGILFEKNAGGGNRINGSEGDTTSPETVGVISLTEDTTAVPRFWNDVYLSGGVLDLTGGGNGLSVSNFYIRDILTGYTGPTRSALFKMSNGRFADLGGTSTLTAADAYFTNTSFATNLTLDDCQGVKFSPTCTLDGITENTANSRFNSWFKAGQIHNTIWTAQDGSLGAIGDGALTMRYSREGESCKIQLEFTFGSTTTTPSGSGQWLFTLPFKGSQGLDQRGLFVNIYDSSDTSDTFSLGAVAADNAQVGFGINGQGVRNGYPLVWAAGDMIIANFEYLVR